MMGSQEVINYLFGIMSAALGWYMKAIWESVKDLQNVDKELAQKVQSIELLVVGKYPTRSEFEAKIEALFSKLDRIENKIDSKADRV